MLKKANLISRHLWRSLLGFWVVTGLNSIQHIMCWRKFAPSSTHGRWLQHVILSLDFGDHTSILSLSNSRISNWIPVTGKLPTVQLLQSNLSLKLILLLLEMKSFVKVWQPLEDYVAPNIILHCHANKF
jgi:hypothetical protein